jgi:drug/metabolite transporter (DMT)-like permease
MNTRTLRSDVLLFTAALIWGFAFVAQRLGMEAVGPFIFNGVRFALARWSCFRSSGLPAGADLPFRGESGTVRDQTS